MRRYRGNEKLYMHSGLDKSSSLWIWCSAPLCTIWVQLCPYNTPVIFYATNYANPKTLCKIVSVFLSKLGARVFFYADYFGVLPRGWYTSLMQHFRPHLQTSILIKMDCMCTGYIGTSDNASIMVSGELAGLTPFFFPFFYFFLFFIFFIFLFFFLGGGPRAKGTDGESVQWMDVCWLKYLIPIPNPKNFCHFPAHHYGWHRKPVLSLTEFCTTAKILLDLGDSASFVKFVLCSRYQNRQVVVNAIQNCLDPEYPIKGLRDFDSLLGIHKDIPVLSSLTLFPLARKEDTLRTNVHLSYNFNFPGVSYMILNQENFHH